MLGGILGRVLLGIGLTVFFLVWWVPFASAQTGPTGPTGGPCDWEWGGVVEAVPTACDVPVLVGVPDPLPVLEVSPTAGSVEFDDAGYFANAVYLGFALVVFLLGLHVVRSFGQRG